MNLKKKISLILNILIVICGIVIFVLSLIEKDMSRISGMWNGMIVGCAMYELCDIIINKENING